jgi:hypothetical protein
MPSWKKVLISGSDAALNSLNISSALTASGLIYPTTDGTSGQFLTTDGSGQLSFSSISGGGLGSTTKLNQTIAATTWSFAHNLNEKFPVINVYDSNDEIIIPQKIDAVDNNNILIYFSSARTGTAAAVVGGTAISASYALTASYVEGIVNSFPYTGSAQITGSLAVTGSIASTEGFTGSLQGNATTSTTASYALTASYLEGLVDPFPYTGSAAITGSLTVTGSTISTQGFTGSLQGTASFAISASYAQTASYLPNPIVSGSIGPVDSIYFNTSSAVSVNVAEIAWNPLDGTFDMGLLNNVTLQVGQEMHFYGKATGAISNGDAVMFAGSQGDHILISKAAQATINTNPEYFIGVATQAFNNNDFGYVTVLGKVRGLNTLAYTQGAVLYFDSEGSTAGALTATKPVAPNAKIEVAAVVRVHANQGILEVRPHVMPKLEDIQDVGITNASFGDLLVRNNDTWRNTKQLSGSYGLTGSLNATSFTGSLSGNASTATSASYALVADSLTPGDKTINGDLTITGRVTAEEFHTEFVSSSIIYRSGSTKFGDSSDDTHAFTGSLRVQGSITGSLSGNASTATTASYALTASYLEGYISPFPFTGSAAITGSLQVTGSITATSFIKSGSTGAYLLDDGSTSTALNSRVETNFIATANQTTFPLTYEIGQIEVYYNGSRLYPDEFVATNGTSVVLVTPATLNAQISIVKYVAALTTTAIRNESIFTTTSGQTTFSVNYAVGQLDVFYNGSKLNPSEFTATNGTSVVLGFACQANESIAIVSYVNQVSGASGTTNRVAKFTGAASLGDSQIFDNGTNVGIGKDSANAKLDVNGNTIITGSLTVTQPITGSLFGNASTSTSASFATTASFANVAGLGGFVQGGNSFGAQALIGTNDNQALALETSGSVRLTIAANGAATFTSSVTVDGAYIGRRNAIYQNSSFTNILNIGRDDDMYGGSNLDGGVFVYGNNRFYISTNSNRRLTVDGSGNVGIGTTTPKAKTEFASGLPTAIPTHTDRTNGIVITDGGAIYGRLGVSNRSSFGAGYPTYLQAGDFDGAIYYNLLLNPLGGNVGIGTTTPSHLLHVMLPSGQNGQIVRLSRSAGSYTWGLGTDSTFSNFNFYNDGGTIVAHINPSSGAYTATSDIKLKENILDSDVALEKVLQIKVRKYDWKNTDIKEDYGFIAQELHEVLPQYVHQGNEETNWGVAKAELVPILVKAIQEQQTLIQSLTDRLSALENK